MAMTGKERMLNSLARKPIDRIGVFEHFWGDTLTAWAEQGHIPDANINPANHFGFDMQSLWACNFVARLDFEPEIVEEDEETLLRRDGNGALLRINKTHEGTPEHVDFLVRDRAGWEEHIKPFITPDPARIDFEGYRKAKQEAEEHNRFFCCSGCNVFELMHPVCGHQYMLMGMAMEPDWIRDMVNTYAETTVALQEILFEKEGYPDGIWYYEDMGFKGRPFMSPAMYSELIQPGHKKTIDFAKSHNLPVNMHSCGYVEPLLPGMIEAGIDCLQVIEVKAGMDLLKLYQDFGDCLSFMGGLDVRVLYANDRAAIDRELESKIPIVKQKNGYILHSDHSIPNQVTYDTYRYFIDRGLELGQYT